MGLGTSSDAALGLGTANMAAALAPNDAQAIASEAYVLLYPVVENYRVMFYQAVWKDSPRFTAPFNTFVHATSC